MATQTCILNEKPLMLPLVIELLCKGRSYPKWATLCKLMLQSEPLPDPQNLLLSSLREQISAKSNPARGEFATGALSRPFSHGMADILDQWRVNQGKLSSKFISNPLDLLGMTNTSRLKVIEQESIQVFKSPDLESSLHKLIFETMEPQDWRLFLGLRTTTGGKDLDTMPPSLNECIEAFTCLHQPISTGTRPIVNQLTVGARALSKHAHRDQKNQFWGNCTGTEKAKNDHANTVLANILCDSVWINLHMLPHAKVVYEVRQSLGYGARWVLHNDKWLFRGFLEPQMEEGHLLGWVH
ncbi:hypothetical protein PHYBLDRAFT_58877 [Phycomyces blakesleeanus NRRL 1555(-)]|uniref:Uncharacterized protein n=1 Tax=Phycomyces blakesleeanus (strain ATCC 8743b / DSM 1359 / FGSC 10004 / NBRC 33097 / NRRL 1555) TaxID=763407 RepID=A0A162V493_PHYB8|nr:hypothetical protein PHYBLDRAFT_58877 [Phycomyces blakesleeanus NRRL 1555(-)]OAD79833.1 hypothetical protein PHYBLDRAFT_58877 [Phycomyces blakesleeanus NRRL 1555(-)]|eukprot:XP_018297873.1 hypothetical protein PHYBLDRAFT_58877 [Phycomyces blakesleeanus NRRL 1555(-)]